MYAYEADLSKYSMIVSVGGDGTHHEVMNGMLLRLDGKKLPLGLIPNGSENVTDKAIGHDTIDEAIKSIVRGELV